MVRTRFSVCCARAPSSLRSSGHDAVDLVQHLLEPELVDLVNDDEEDLVVFVGAWRLQVQQLIDLQIAAVGDCRGVGTVLRSHAPPGGAAPAEAPMPYFSTLRVFML